MVASVRSDDKAEEALDLIPIPRAKCHCSSCLTSPPKRPLSVFPRLLRSNPLCQLPYFSRGFFRPLFSQRYECSDCSTVRDSLLLR